MICNELQEALRARDEWRKLAETRNEQTEQLCDRINQLEKLCDDVTRQRDAYRETALRSEVRAELLDPSAVALIIEELERATEKFGRFKSAHEGYAVLLEEVDELWQEVKSNNRDGQEEEAIQVAAMALRYLHDLCGMRVESSQRADPGGAGGHVADIVPGDGGCG